METENVEIIKAMVRTASASASSPGRRRLPTSDKQLFCSRIAGVSLVRQTGWLYPKWAGYLGRSPR